MKYILYARKSSEDKGRQMLSLDSQISTMKIMAKDLDLNIVKIFEEEKSAKRPDNRPKFSEMMKLLEQGKADAIICWKLDRLSRNPVDSGKIQWMLQQGIIKEIQASERKYLPEDNAIIFNVESGMANQYIRDLSKNVKRGNKTKLEKGGWPGFAPLGYLNDKAEKTIIIDPKCAPFIPKMFDLYNIGTHSLKDIADILYAQGFRSRGGNKVHKSKIQDMLSNSFYCGIMTRDGMDYLGSHEPVISRQVFDIAQGVKLGRIHSKRQRLFFTFRGFLRCEVCGCTVTASVHKGYDYYYCTNGKGLCVEHKAYLRSEDLEGIVATELEDIQFDEETIETMYQASKEKVKNNEKYKDSARQSVLTQLESIAKRQAKLLDNQLDEIITDEVYRSKFKELHNQKVALEQQLQKIEKTFGGGMVALERTKEIYLKASRAKKDFLELDKFKKRKMLENILWNLEINDKKIAQVSYKMPYEALKKSPKSGDFSEMLGMRDSNPRMHGPKPCALPLG